MPLTEPAQASWRGQSGLLSPSPWVVSKERCLLLTRQTGDLLPPPEPLVNATGPSETSALGMGVKSRICRHARLRYPGLIQTRSQQEPAELANKPTTSKPAHWKPRMLVGWVLQHHLRQRHATERPTAAGQQGGPEGRPPRWARGLPGPVCSAPAAQCRPLCVPSPPGRAGNRKCPSLLQ